MTKWHLARSEALKEAGLVPAEDVKLISVDATAGAFQAMLDGTLNVAIECNPLLAPQVYEAALAALNGETLPKWIPSQESEFYMTDPNLKEIAAAASTKLEVLICYPSRMADQREVI